MAALPALFTACVLLLTPLPRADTTVYLTKEQALERVFPDAGWVRELRHLLSKSEIDSVEALTGAHLDEGGFFLYAAGEGEQASDYAVIVSQIGKVKPITHIVGVHADGSIGEVAVMVYRETHGHEVARDRFMEQYRGKTLQDTVRIDRDIINIAGATLSGHAICRGVRKALAVVEVVFRRRTPEQRNALLTTAEDVTPSSLRGTGADRTSREQSLRSIAADHVRVERAVMGTACSIEAYAEPGMSAEDLLEAVEAALSEVERWDGILSDWKPDTPLSRFNVQPVDEPWRADADLLVWLRDARRWSLATESAFDPTVGTLVDAWGLRTSQPARPADSVLEAARAATGWELIDLDTTAGTLIRLHPRVRLDPGGSGKGFALDRAGQELQRQGVRRALLSFRSTMLALLPPPGRASWSIPVAHDGDGRTLTTVELTGHALSVSGGSLRAFQDQGVERGHVLDPRSGTPVPAERLAWVVHSSAAASDALATALLVTGPGLADLEGAQGAFVATAGSAPVTWPPQP